MVTPSIVWRLGLDFQIICLVKHFWNVEIKTEFEFSWRNLFFFTKKEIENFHFRYLLIRSWFHNVRSLNLGIFWSFDWFLKFPYSNIPFNLRLIQKDCKKNRKICRFGFGLVLSKKFWFDFFTNYNYSSITYRYVLRKSSGVKSEFLESCNNHNLLI